MSRSFLVFLALGLGGVSCVLAYSMIGTTVDETGLLREPFFLIPIGYLLMLVGTVGALFLGLKRLVLGQPA